MTMNGPLRVGPGRYDLLGGAADLAGLGLLAARCAAGLRRVEGGGGLDEDDKSALHGLSALFASSAEAVEFFDTAGQRGIPPGDALSARVDLAIDSVLQTEAQTDDHQAVAQSLKALAESVEAVVETPSTEAAHVLVGICSDLADAVLRETGQVGESSSSFPAPTLDHAELASVR
jgi:hypothetical protein